MLTLWLQEKEILPNVSLGHSIPHSDLAPPLRAITATWKKAILNWLTSGKPLHKEKTWNKDAHPNSQFCPQTK